MRTYRVIYDAIDELEAAMKGMLDPNTKNKSQDKQQFAKLIMYLE